MTKLNFLIQTFSKSAAIIFDGIDNEKDGVLPSSKCVKFIEKLEEGFHSEDLAGHIQKLYSNKSGSLERFALVRWYMD